MQQPDNDCRKIPLNKKAPCLTKNKDQKLMRYHSFCHTALYGGMTTHLIV